MCVSLSHPRGLARLAPALSLVVAAACAGSGSGGMGQSGPAGQRASVSSAPKSDWIQMFDGKDLSGWDIKFAKHELNDNFNNTFRVEEGLLKVRYDKWNAFHGEFGHIFYKQPFSYYLLAAEYRFVGNQVAGAGPSLEWALRNNGIMVHGQTAESMGLNQDFPSRSKSSCWVASVAVRVPRPTSARKARTCTSATH